MDVIECINSRRTVREFSSRPVKESDLFKVLNSATEGPAAGNIRNLRLIVVKDSESKKEIVDAALNQRWMLDAPYFIVVCSVTDTLEREYGARGKGLYDFHGIGAAIQNMLLAANSLGLATAWVGAFSDSQIRITLKIPDNVRIHAIIPLGKALRQPKQVQRRAELSDVLYFNKWDEKEESPSIFPISKKIKEIDSNALRNVAKKIIRR